jgi:hypothetical protein
MNSSSQTRVGDTLHAVLGVIVPDLQRCCIDPWTLIGSAAAALAGAPVTVADIDVLTSRRDAQTIAGRWHECLDAAYVPMDGDRFRSWFARFRYPGLAVEVMGGLELFGAAGWKVVRIDDIIDVNVGGLAVPIPTVGEQLRVLRSFGRPKDRQRMALLETLGTGAA